MADGNGRVGVKQCMHSFHSLDCLLGVSFYNYMSKLVLIFYLANFVCFCPSDCFNTDQVMSKSCLFSFSFQIYFELFCVI